MFRNYDPAHSLWHPEEPLSPNFGPVRSNGSAVAPVRRKGVGSCRHYGKKLAVQIIAYLDRDMDPVNHAKFQSAATGDFGGVVRTNTRIDILTTL